MERLDMDFVIPDAESLAHDGHLENLIVKGTGAVITVVVRPHHMV